MSSPDVKTPGAMSAAKRELLRKRLQGNAGTGPGIPQHSEQDRAPLSPAQRGVWVLDHFLGPSGLYNIHQCLWLCGPLDVTALSVAIDDVLERHQALRATTPYPGLPVQVFVGPRPGTLTVTDLTGLPTASREKRALELAAEVAARAFNLADGPLIRAALILLGDETHLLVLALHHLVCDERSMEVLEAELAAAYQARLAAGKAVFPPLPVHYRDYAAQQAGSRDHDQIAYWKEALSGLPPLLELPADWPRPPVPSHEGDRVHLDLGPDVRDGTRRLAATLSCTTFTVVLSAFAAALHRYTGQPRFAVGTLLSGRTRPELDDLIGLFAHPAAIVADFSDDPTFAVHADRMHTRVGEALAHQDVAFEDVVEAVRPDRDLAANPLFQALYQHEDTSAQAWRLPGLHVVEARLEDVQAKVDIALFTADDGHSLTADLVFATDLFSRHTAERILRHFGRLLAGAIGNPAQPVSTLPLLSLEERAAQLALRNDNHAGYPRDACLHELFEAQVDRTPEAVAIAGRGVRVTYRELDERASRLAWYLRALGVRAETRVGVCLEHGPEMFAALLGVLKAGGAYVPLDPAHPAERLAYVLGDTGASVVITQNSLAGLLPGNSARVIRMDGDAAALDRCPATRLGRTAAAENLVYVMYTSGSTGRPKGVMISHRGLNNYLWWAIDGYGLDGAHGAPMVGSIAFDLSVPNFFLPLIGGRDVTLLPPDASQQALAELLVQPGDFSLLKITPAHLDVLRSQLLDRPGTVVDAVRTYVIGADEVKPDTADGWRRLAPGARLINEYGPTETVVGCSVYEIPAESDRTRPVSIGHPIANMTMYVLDSHLEPVPPGVAGEIYIGGDGVARGYLGMPGLTADRFVPDPYGPPGGRLYRTGDRARARTDGDLEFLGRLDHQVKIRGYRIEFGEIEAQLLLNPAVIEAVVAVREDRTGTKRLVAYVVPERGAEDPAALRKALREVLPEYMVPADFVMLDKLPLSDGGKVDRRLLPAPERAASAGQATAPRSSAERLLASLCAELLDLPQVSVTGNFFELGGDSLLAIQLAVRAKARGLQVTPSLVFQHQTIEELATVALPVPDGTAEARAAESAPVTAEGLAEVPMSPSQARLLSTRVRHEYYIPVVLLDVRSSPPPEQLEQVLRELTVRHQALRLRVDGQSGKQYAAARETARLLRTMTAGSGLAATAQELRAGLDLGAGPLLQAALIQGPDRDLLMLAAHHFAVDGISWEILLGELAALWPGTGRVPPPPAGPSFAAWAGRLHALAWSDELAAEAPYWFGLPPATLVPVDHPGGRNTTDTVKAVTAALPATAATGLAARYRTGISDLAVSALALTLTSWTGESSITVEMTGHGRDDTIDGADPARIVGWLSCGYPVTLRPGRERDLGSALAQVSQSLRAVPRSGLGYGLLRDIRGDEIARRLRARPWPGVLVNYQGHHRASGEADQPFTRMADAPDVEAAGAGPRDHLLEINLGVLGGRLVAEWRYSSAMHDEATVRRLADDWLRRLRPAGDS